MAGTTLNTRLHHLLTMETVLEQYQTQTNSALLKTITDSPPTTTLTDHHSIFSMYVLLLFTNLLALMFYSFSFPRPALEEFNPPPQIITWPCKHVCIYMCICCNDKSVAWSAHYNNTLNTGLHHSKLIDFCITAATCTVVMNSLNQRSQNNRLWVNGWDSYVVICLEILLAAAVISLVCLVTRLGVEWLKQSSF